MSYRHNQLEGKKGHKAPICETQPSGASLVLKQEAWSYQEI